LRKGTNGAGGERLKTLTGAVDAAVKQYIDMNKIINSVKKKIQVDAQCTTILEDEKTIQMLEYAVEIAEKQFSNFCHETRSNVNL